MALTKELSDRVVRTAHQLRLTQIGLADESPDARRGFLRDVLDQAVADLSQAERAGFLETLRDRFPGPGNSAPLPRAADAPAAAEEPFSRLAERFFRAAAALDVSERMALTRQMQEEGLVPEAEPEPVSRLSGSELNPRAVQAMKAVMKKLELQKLDLTRTMKLLLLLLESTGKNDQLMWSTWRAVAPKAKQRRPCDLREEMLKYIGGDASVSGAVLQDQVKQLNRLSACMIAGMGKAGSQFARQHLRKFMPEEIMANAGDGGLFANQESRYWDHYVRLSSELSEDNVEYAIREAVARFTESLLQR